MLVVAPYRFCVWWASNLEMKAGRPAIRLPRLRSICLQPNVAITALAVFSCAAEDRKVPRKIACVD